MNQYERLLQKLDAFIRRYYFNQLVRGILLFLTAIGAIILILSVGEYFLYLRSWMKISLLIIFGIMALSALVFWIIRPAFAMQKIGKIISREQAASIIGRFFPEVKDKLLNVLQLQNSTYVGESSELAIAGVERKAEQISVIPILKAVNLKGNRRYLKWLIPVVAIIAVIALATPQVFKQAAFRLSQPGKNFYPPPPFTFHLNNKTLETPLNSDFTVSLTVDGDKLPKTVTVNADGQKLLMSSTSKNRYDYTFHNVRKKITFHFLAAGFRSQNYHLKILERPQLAGATIKAYYPAYTGIKNETLDGLNQITVPEGTRLVWQLTTKNTTRIVANYFGHSSQPLAAKGSDKNLWTFQAIVHKDTAFQFILSNKVLPNYDTLQVALTAIPDRPPQITAQQAKDSITGRQVLITGSASDDYGLSKLLFHYKIFDANNKAITDTTLTVMQPQNATTLNYHYYFDINTLHLAPGQSVQYFIEAWDNDAVHGPKEAISQVFSYQQPNSKQLDKNIQQNNEVINDQLSNTTNQSENINENLEKLRNEMLQNKGMTWEQKDQLKDIANQQHTLQNKINALKKRFELQQRQSQQKNYSISIRKKQQALEKQLDKVQNKDLAKLMKKLQQMLKKDNKANTFQELQQWQQQNKLFQMDMKRLQELMKQLTLQMKLEDIAQKARQLAKSQDSLAQKTLSQKANNKDLAKSQHQLQQQLNQLLNKGFKKAAKDNQQTENPKNLQPAKDAGKQAAENMQNSTNSLQNGNRQQSGAHQKSASKNLNKMAASLSKMAGGMNMEMININIRSVRQLLTNLLRFSFGQEALMNAERHYAVNIKVYEKRLKAQHELKQNAEMIKDSLVSLSKRVFRLAPTINVQTTEWNDHINKSIALMENRRVGQARVEQQYAMTNANNLALMLDETLRHLMQMQSQAKGGGMGSSGKGKPKPGGNSPGQMMKDIITGQQQLGKGLGQLKGQQSGQGQNQKNGGSSSNHQAEQLAKLATEQAQLRQMMQDVSSMLNSQGNGQNAQLIKEIQKAMNQNEVDFVNRHLTSELVKRQHRIMTRLLKAQDAIRQQETDNKRVSQTAKELPSPMPPELKFILQKRQSFLESYQTVPATLKPFYKRMTKKYQQKVHSKK